MTGSRAALVFGNGPAGLLAAIVLRQAGWMVQVVPANKGERGHHRHAHHLAATTIAAMESLCGCHLAGWRIGPLLRIDGAASPVTGEAPVTDVARMINALAQRAAELGVAGAAPWASLAGAGKGYALLVDATGSGVMASRAAGASVSIDESAESDACWTWRGHAQGGSPFWSAATRDFCDVEAAWLVRGEDGACVLTVRPARSGAAPPSPGALLDALMIAAGHDWARRMGTLRLGAVPMRHRAPVARRVHVDWPQTSPPLLRLGDALVQTAPRFGQGFAQIVEQMDAMLPALRGEIDLCEGVRRVETLAERRWLGAMMQSAIRPTIAA